MDFAAERARMVRRQLRRRGISDERVLEAMGEVPREDFVMPADRRLAYNDGALSIGHGQTISQPWIVAAICQALDPRPGDEALEIGTGSGYSTAVLARLCRVVTSCEIVEPLCEQAVTRLRDSDNVEVICGDGAAEPPGGPYDVIAVHATAPAPPVPLLDRLRPGGRLVAPVRTPRGEVLTRFARSAEGFEQEEIAQVRFVPLTGRLGR